MAVNRISVADLVKFEEGDKIDLTELEENKDSVYAAIREEVFDAAKQTKKKSKKAVEDFYEVVPSTSLEKMMDKILQREKAKETGAVLFEKNFKYEFDKKMRRIKRIKSKTYRRIRRQNKLKNKEALEENMQEDQGAQEDRARPLIPDVLLKEVEEVEEDTPILSFGGDESRGENEQERLVRLAFKDDIEEQEKAFAKEKEEVVNEEAPRVEEVVLPGWGEWAGPGLEVVKTKSNTIRNIVEGIKYSNRKDFNRSHIIINEKALEVDKRFLAELPFGYTENEYNEKIGTSISRERNTLRIFRKLVRSKACHTNSKAIEPFHYSPE
ncbi:Utp14 protein [Encephalitozoon hellem]|nr:Utp14 protein [Encephalitozoon hellem]